MYRSPVYLKKGDVVGLVAPGGKVSIPDIQGALRVMKLWGVEVKWGKYLFEENFQFAGTDEQRIEDFQQMLDDPQVQAIICARGGYGTTRIIDQLDFSTFMNKPKWIAGYSDITALHCHLHARGIQSIHSIMPVTFAKEDTVRSVESLRKVLFGEPVMYEVPVHPLNKEGVVRAPIIGGNLALLASITGTPSDIDTKGKIFFIEDINEYLYNIDRMMIQLKRSGKLKNLAGLIIGRFTDVKDNDIPFGMTPEEIVLDAVKEYNYPICAGFPVGHEPENVAIVCGKSATLSVQSEGVKLDLRTDEISV